MYLSGTDSSACGNPNRFWEMLNGQRLIQIGDVLCWELEMQSIMEEDAPL